jgi:methionyl aminopeptidase
MKRKIMRSRDQNAGRAPALSPPAHPGPNDRCWCGSGKKYKRCHQQAEAAGEQAREQQKRDRRVRPGTITPGRVVPAHIPRPDYVLTGEPKQGPMNEVKSPEQIGRMRAACRAAAQVLEKAGAAVRPGIATDELDAIAHQECIRLGAYPSPLNYHGFPKSICTSVNEVICHGIPDSRLLQNGDIVNLDITVFLNGVHGDTSATFLVGEVDEASRKLVQVTRECMMLGIRAVRPGEPANRIGKVIEEHASKQGYGVVRAYCGHGIGERFHTSIQIPHYYDPSVDWIMEPGMTFTIEPMITLGTWEHRLWKDGWTAVTADLERTAQFEHTVLVTKEGAEILTV